MDEQQRSRKGHFRMEENPNHGVSYHVTEETVQLLTKTDYWQVEESPNSQSSYYFWSFSWTHQELLSMKCMLTWKTFEQSTQNLSHSLFPSPNRGLSRQTTTKTGVQISNSPPVEVETFITLCQCSLPKHGYAYLLLPRQTSFNIFPLFQWI